LIALLFSHISVAETIPKPFIFGNWSHTCQYPEGALQFAQAFSCRGFHIPNLIDVCLMDSNSMDMAMPEGETRDTRAISVKLAMLAATSRAPRSGDSEKGSEERWRKSDGNGQN
jgi:hypothetical protein